MCSTLKLTKSWTLARLPSTKHNHVALWSFVVQEMMNMARYFTRRSKNMEMMMIMMVMHQQLIEYPLLPLL
jgi:hypothetical protein